MCELRITILLEATVTMCETNTYDGTLMTLPAVNLTQLSNLVIFST